MPHPHAYPNLPYREYHDMPKRWTRKGYLEHLTFWLTFFEEDELLGPYEDSPENDEPHPWIKDLAPHLKNKHFWKKATAHKIGHDIIALCLIHINLEKPRDWPRTLLRMNYFLAYDSRRRYFTQVARSIINFQANPDSQDFEDPPQAPDARLHVFPSKNQLRWLRTQDLSKGPAADVV